MPYPTLPIPTLKILTEKADGLRDRNLCVAVVGEESEPAGSPNVRRIDVLPCDKVKLPNERILFELQNLYPLKFKTRTPTSLALEPTPKVKLKSGRDVSTVDAWFTSPAAVDKFVVPYYSRVLGPQWAFHIQTTFYGDGRILAVVHLPESYEDLAEAADSTTQSPMGFHGVIPADDASLVAVPLEVLTMQFLATQ